MTNALLDQKIHSLDPIDAWWLDRLHAGSPTRGGNRWSDFISTKTLVDDFATSADKVGVHRKSFDTQFGIRFLKIVPGVRKVRRSVPIGETSATERTWGYELPPLARCREAFEEAVGQEVDWDRTDEGWKPPHAD